MAAPEARESTAFRLALVSSLLFFSTTCSCMFLCPAEKSTAVFWTRSFHGYFRKTKVDSILREASCRLKT